MKPLVRSLLVAAFVAGSASGAALPSFDVTVREKAGGKVVSTAKTDSRGKFSTTEVQPGRYTVEFRAKNSAALAGSQLEISVSPGKGPATQASAPGARFGGGVALAVDVKRASALSGQVATGTAQATADTAETKGPVRAGSVKIINGKRYVWMPPEMGSNMGGKWVEEGTDEAALSISNKKGGDSQVLRSIQDQSSNVGQR